MKERYGGTGFVSIVIQLDETKLLEFAENARSRSLPDIDYATYNRQ